MKIAIAIAVLFILMGLVAQIDKERPTRVQRCHMEGWGGGCVRMYAVDYRLP